MSHESGFTSYLKGKGAYSRKNTFACWKKKMFSFSHFAHSSSDRHVRKKGPKRVPTFVKNFVSFLAL